MVEHQVECLWTLISFLVQLFKAVMKALVHRRPDRSSLMGTMAVNKECSLEESSGAASDKKGIEDVSKSVVGDQVAQKVVKKLKRRPSRIVIPDSCAALGFSDQKMVIVKEEEKDLEVEGAGYCLVSKKGKRHVMEDGYQIITEINGDSMQAFFGVFDGHGGRAAVDFVSEKLGKNIIRAAQMLEDQGGADKLEVAIRSGYLTTDKEFLSQGVNSGACAATVLLKGRELYVSNVGDCRVVMSNKGEANSLTTDHRPGREDERNRIESLGGYVSCRKGVWRVQDSLAVSRAIGDVNMKEWVISEPETRKLHLTPECQFLIMASDGLWDKVTDQEAVDVVLKSSNMMKACKQLTEISCSRGSRDDITVMVVDIQKFVQPGGEKIIKPKL